MENKLTKDKIDKAVKEACNNFNFPTVDKFGNMHFKDDNHHIVLGAKASEEFDKVMKEELDKQFKDATTKR